MVDEQDINGWIETDGDTEYDIGGVVERDSEEAPATTLPIPRPLSRPFSGPLGGI